MIKRHDDKGFDKHGRGQPRGGWAVEKSCKALKLCMPGHFAKIYLQRKEEWELPAVPIEVTLVINILYGGREEGVYQIYPPSTSINNLVTGMAVPKLMTKPLRKEKSRS